MNHAALRAFLLGCSLVAPAAGAERELEIRLAWPGGFDLRCGIPIGSSRLLLIGGNGTGGPIGFAAGLDGPFVRAGPLVEAGLLREAAGPLSFGPGTDVSAEATGLRLDGSFDAPAEASVQLSPAPEVRLFWLRPAGGVGVLGCVSGPAHLGPLSLEVVAAVSGVGTPAADTAWLRDGPPVPPGRAMQGSARIRLGLPGFSAAVSAGASAAERAPPGWFALGTASLVRGDSGIDLLAAVASVDYLELGGGDDPGGMRTGIGLRFAGRGGRFTAKYTLTVDPPGFAAGPFLHSVEDLEISLVRRWKSGAGSCEAGLSASNRIETGTDGERADDPSGCLSIERNDRVFRAGLFVDISRDDGTAVEVSLGTGDAATRASASMEARCSFSSGPACLEAAATLRLVLDAGQATVRAGFRDAPLAPGGLGVAHPCISLAWSLRTPYDRPSAGRAP